MQDNLCELGADSLHIFQSAARANRAGIDIAMAQCLKCRTIASLLAQLRNGASDGEKWFLPTIVPAAREKYRVKHLSP